MGVYQFARKMLKAEFRQCLMFMVSIVISNAVLFNLFNLIYNGEFTTFDYGNTYQFAYASITMLAMVVAMILVFFTNSYFIIKKTKEIAIATLSGRSSGEIAAMIAYQNMVILAISLVLGLGLGVIIMPLFLKAMYMSLGISGGIFIFSLEGFTYTMIVITMEFIWIILINVGFVFRREIKDLISEEKKSYSGFKVRYKIPGIIYWIGLLLPFITYVGCNIAALSELEKSKILYTSIMGSIVFAYAFIKYYLPDLLIKIKNKKGYENKIIFMVSSNLQYSITKCADIVGVLIIFSVSLIKMACDSADIPLVRMLAIIAVIVIVILVALILLYKVAIEAENRKRNFKQLLLIGYTLDEVRRLIVSEVSWFYGMIISIPFSYIALLCYSNIRMGTMGLSFTLNILGIFLIILMSAYIGSIIIYKKIIMNYLRNNK